MTKEEMLDAMKEEIPYKIASQLEPYILEAMELYSEERVRVLTEALEKIMSMMPPSYDEHRIAKEALNTYNNTLNK